MEHNSNLKLLVYFLLIMGGIVLLGGCSNTLFSGSDSGSTMGNVPPPISKSIVDYPDIELPSDMDLDNDESMAIRTDSFMGGILSFSGRIEMQSLKDFIIASMKRNKWKVVGEASSETIMLAFTKPNKTCMVVIDEDFGGSLGKTHVYLYVTADRAAAKRLNPFGESTR